MATQEEREAMASLVESAAYQAEYGGFPAVAVKLTAAAAELRKGDWQPIETFDVGETIDGNEAECDSVLVVYDDVVGEAIYRGEQHGWWWVGNYPTDAHGSRIYPQLWMPMPLSPEGTR